MKKFIGVLMGLALVLSLNTSFAQITGGSVNVVCVRYNADGSCAQTSVGVGVTTGSGSGTAGAPAGGTTGGAVNGAYSQGSYTRSNNTADLSFVANLLAQFGGIIGMLPKILTGVAVVVFFWFLIRYFVNGSESPEAKKKNLSGMLYSLLAIFIMVALWGILAFFGDALGINPNTTVNAVQLPR